MAMDASAINSVYSSAQLIPTMVGYHRMNTLYRKGEYFKY